MTCYAIKLAEDLHLGELFEFFGGVDGRSKLALNQCKVKLSAFEKDPQPDGSLRVSREASYWTRLESSDSMRYASLMR